MSADPDKDTAFPSLQADTVAVGSSSLVQSDTCHKVSEKKRKKPSRSVHFPDEDVLVTQYFEPANPWHDVPTTNRATLAAEYLESCRRHNTTPIDCVLQQIRELPENSIGGGNRAARFALTSCSLAGSAPVDALEALLRKVQFRRVEVQHCELDDEGAEALFDMIEYYESANAVGISGPRQFGIRGWQAACRMIKKSAELSEVSLCESALCASHAPVLVRALKPHTCRLRSLCLQRAELRGEPLLCLVIALKSNTSIRELRLPDNQLSISDAQQLASLLRLNLHIQLLDLSNNDIQDAGTGHIADALVEQAAQTPPSAGNSPLSPHHYYIPGGREARRGLAFLVLWNNQLTRNCAPHLTKALSSSQSLCVLNIGRNALGADTVRALQCGGALVSLGLQSARLGPGAARPLADLLKADTKLQRLDLRDNRLGVVGLQAILAAMQENTTLTQIDLDDPAEATTLTADNGEAATVARLTHDITALCRRNEPPSTEPERRVHRKISLTCHTAMVAKTSPTIAEAARSRTSRLRSPAPSPAPSPAGSPIPHNHHNSRFNVTRVTPDRESSPGSTSPLTPTRTTYCLTPSRFKVVQVAEPPQIQVHPATQKQPTSRFSVTRNYDAMYNPSVSPTPSSGSGSPNTSPSPSASPVPNSPIVIACQPMVTSSSPKVIASLPTGISSSPTVVASLSTTISGSPMVTAGLVTLAAEENTAVSSTPTVISRLATAISDSPIVMDGLTSTSTVGNIAMDKVMTGSPVDTSDSPLVINTVPVIQDSVKADTATMMSDSTMITVGSPTVITTSVIVSKLLTDPTMKSNSKTVNTGFPLATAAPTVIDWSAIPSSTMMSSISPGLPIVMPISPIAMETSPAIMPDAPKETSNSIKVIDSTTTVITDLSKTISESLSLEIMPSISETVGIKSPPEVLSNDSQLSTLTSTIAASLSIEKTTDSMLSAVPSVIHVSSLTETDSKLIYARKTSQEPDETNRERCNSICITNESVDKQVMSKRTSACPFESETAVTKNNMESSNLISAIVSGTPSVDTLTGAVVSGTSLDTLSRIMIEEVSNMEGIESEMVRKTTDIEPYLANIGTNLESAAIPINLLEPRVVPNSRFSISPIHDNFGITHEYCGKNDISKPVAIGSQTNALTTDKQQNRSVPIYTEADILTKIAEITETVAPKVVEPKVTADTLNYEKKDMSLFDTIAHKNKDLVSEDNTLITVFADLYSKTDKYIDVNRPLIDISQRTMPIQDLKLKDDSNKFKLGDSIDLKIPTADIKLSELPVKKSDERFDNIDLKSVLKDELEYVEAKSEIPKEIQDKEEDHWFGKTTELDTVTPSKTIFDSDKISETKTSDSEESVNNKTYSDVVKGDPKYKDKSEQLTHKEEISDNVVKSVTKLVKNSVQASDTDKLDVQIEVTVKKESVQHPAKVHSDQNKDFINIDDIIAKKEPRTMKQIEAITVDLGNIIQDMKEMSSKSRKVKSDCTVDIASVKTNTVPGNFSRDLVLKKNKSESSLDSPDLEVSRLMNKKLVGSPFCDSSSSLEISGSSMESLNATDNLHATCHVIPKHVVIREAVESDIELDRRKDIALSTGSSMESTSEVTPVNSGNLLNMSVSSNESVSPIIFGKKRKIHDSLSSLEASVSSLDSGRHEKVMVTSADSGIEYSYQQPSENKEDNSSNEGTLTHNSSLRETVKKTDQETLTHSPKRASSLLDVPALKTKGLDRMRKISWVAPSSSFHIPRPEPEKLEKPSHLEKLLSLFQHPTSLFSRGSQSDEERKSASNTPPRKDSSLTSSFWSWGSTIEKEKDEKEDSSEATDSTLSERVQVSFVDESFSKKLDSKTPSTDTDNTLSEFQSFPTQTSAEKVTDNTTDEELVQKCLGLSLNDKAGSNGNDQRASDTTDLSKPNDLNRNYDVSDIKDDNCENRVVIDKDENKEEAKIESNRPRSFAAVLKSSGSENSLDKQPSPDIGQTVDKLPSKVIRGIKENISPENTLTSSVTNTKTLVLELTERPVQHLVGPVWEVPTLEKSEFRMGDIKAHSDMAPIATIEETCDEAADNTVNVKLEYIDDVKNYEIIQTDRLKVKEKLDKQTVIEATTESETVDLGKDALSYLIYERQAFEADTEHAVATKVQTGSLAQELKEAEIKEMLDLSPELILDEALKPEVFASKEIIGVKSPVLPERSKLKKANSLEDLSQRDESTKSSSKTKTIAFKVPETQPRDIPRTKLRTMSGSSPKSLPESLNKPCPLAKIDTCLKKRKKISSLGKIANDSLLALNMSEDETAEYRRSYGTSAESLRSLESVSEDANSQSGTSVDSRCRSCLRTSQESLMSLDSITDDCKCGNECEKSGRSVR